MDSVERAVITVWIVSGFTMCFIDVYKRPYAGYDFLPRDRCTIVLYCDGPDDDHLIGRNMLSI